MEGWVETTVESHHHLIGALPQLFDAPPCRLEIECNRLLTHHPLASADGLEDVVDVELRRRPDDDCIDHRVREHVVRLQAVAHIVLLGEGTCVLLEWVADKCQSGIGTSGDGSSVDVANTSSPNDGDPDHAVNPCVRHSWLSASTYKILLC